MNTINSIVGPIQAEALENEDQYLMNYISLNGADSIQKDTLISSITTGEKVILSGVRGSGKTMVLKTGEALQTKVFSEMIKNNNSNLILPCYITFAGFKNDVSLEDELDVDKSELKVVKEVFRGYFYISLLNEILNQLDKYEVDQSVEFNFFGIKTKFGIKRQIKLAIHKFKQIGFKELTVIQKKGAKLGVEIPKIESVFNVECEKGSEVKSLTIDDMQKTALFKSTLESICKTYGISKIHFLFDEVFYLKYLQSEFFDILFGFRNFQYCSFTLTAYPTLMDYGNEFDIPDDAKILEVNQKLYKPNKYEYEKPIYKFIERRIKIFGKKNFESILSEDGLEQLILYTNGNPRILLQSIDYLWQQNRTIIKRISITNDVVNYIVYNFYITYLERQSKRYNINLEKITDFLEIIIGRLKENNERSDNGTIFFLLDKSIINHFTKTIDLLQYCRIIEQYKMGDFGGSISKKGTVFSINPMYARFHGVFSRSQINRLPEMVENAIQKDRKIQFSSLDTFLDKSKKSLTNSCPRNLDEQCEVKLCNDAYSEAWKVCPFNGLKLSTDEVEENQKDEEIKLDCLPISRALIKRLNDINIFTVFEVVDYKIDGLKKAKYIGAERAKLIYYLSLEYIEDNL